MHASCNNSDDVKDSFYKELRRVYDQFPKYVMKILLDAFSEKIGMGDILEPAVGNEGSHEINNGNGVRVVNFTTSENLVAKSTMFPHRNFQKYCGTLLRKRRTTTNILDVRCFRWADFVTDRYLIVAEVRDRQRRNGLLRRRTWKVQSHEFIQG
jgi:hypothetical protein